MNQFDQQVDPVNFAIDCGKEKIARYLVEKAFSLHHVYWVSKKKKNHIFKDITIFTIQTDRSKKCAPRPALASFKVETLPGRSYGLVQILVQVW